MKQRYFYFDNAKFILIFFVVFGHMIRSFIEDSEMIFTIYKVIYSFHMPAFILVSGFFAKGFYQKGYIVKITKKLIVPYLIFQLIYSIYYYYLNGQTKIEWDLLNPHWSLWFLISLFWWNLMLLLVSKYKAFTSIIISMIIGLLVGYVDYVTNYLSLSRTFVFFPFFLLGYYLTKDHIRFLFKTRCRLVALAIFVIVFAGFYCFPNNNYEWLLGSKPYGDISGASVTAMFTRLGFYFLSFLMVFSFMSLVPRKQYFFTQLGKNTLYVYLLHGFFIKTFRKSEIQNYFHDPEQFLLLVVMSLLLTLVLSNRIAISVIQPLIEFRWSQIILLKVRGIAIFKFYLNKYQSH